MEAEQPQPDLEPVAEVVPEPEPVAEVIVPTPKERAFPAILCE
jgi:hypothetical protein